MSRTYDVIVVGAGIFGASAAYHLKKAGAARVLLVERGAGPAAGTTRASAAIVRQHYSNRVLCELTGESIAILTDLGRRRARGGLFTQAGWYFLVPEPLLAGARENIAMQRDAGVVTSLLDIKQASRELAWLNPDGIAAVAFEPGSGYADPVRCVEALVEEFVRLGGEVLFKKKCHGLIRSGNRIEGVVIEHESLLAGCTVNACGPWSKALASSANIDLQMVAYREQETIWDCNRAAEMPPSSISDAADAIYVRPMGGGRYTVGRGYPKPYTEVDPGAYEETVDDDFVNDVLQRLQLRFIPFSNAKYLDGFASLYDVTPDWYPFVGLRSDIRGYADASGGSGHGFKLAPALGAHLSQWVLNGSVKPGVRELSYDRVSAGRMFVQKYGGNRG